MYYHRPTSLGSIKANLETLKINGEHNSNFPKRTQIGDRLNIKSESFTSLTTLQGRQDLKVCPTEMFQSPKLK